MFLHVKKGVQFGFKMIFLRTEIAEVANNLNSLEEALDEIEERADRIRAQLLELLTSSREIRQSIREENNKMDQCELNDEDSNDKPDDGEPSN